MYVYISSQPINLKTYANYMHDVDMKWFAGVAAYSI